MADGPNSTTEKLKAALDEAYEKHPKSCSHSVWHVITKVFDANFEYRQANELIAFLDQASSKWHPVAVQKGLALANEGKVVVGGLKDTPHGHVVAIYPGNMIPRGGYSYVKGGKLEKVRQAGAYARCMSTSIGAWPGAKSKGEKTVWDPWGNDAKFDRVMFWSPL